jgi:hypothetical protein
MPLTYLSAERGKSASPRNYALRLRFHEHNVVGTWFSNHLLFHHGHRLAPYATSALPISLHLCKIDGPARQCPLL